MRAKEFGGNSSYTLRCTQFDRLLFFWVWEAKLGCIMGICISRSDATESQGLCCLTRSACLSRSDSRPVMVTKTHFARTLHDSSCYWVYAGFAQQQELVTRCFYAIDIKEKKYVPLPNHSINTYSDSASSVLDYKIYFICGGSRPLVTRFVQLYDPMANLWSATNRTTLARIGAVAVSVDGKVYVFGGCPKQIAAWAEVYEPSTNTWTIIPRSEVLIEALDRGLSPIRASAVLGKKIILRGSRTGIAFDVMSNSWTHVSENLMKSWWGCSRAAVVRNMLITCHREYGQREILQLSIRAYDPDQDAWLMLEGIDMKFHENAHRSQFMAVNGKLVIYHMWEQNDLRFSIIEINQKLRTTVRASLMWQSRFPIATIIGKDLPELDIYHIDRRKNVHQQNLLEALRADGLPS